MSDPDQETIIRNYYLLEEWAHTDTEAVPEERDGNGN